MKLTEFKAWFDGFTEDMDGAPTETQWERIKGRVKEITGETVSYPVYIDRYARPFGYPYAPYWAAQGVGLLNQGLDQSNASLQGASLQNYCLNQANAQGIASLNSGANQANNAFDSVAAMCALGKADAGNC